MKKEIECSAFVISSSRYKDYDAVVTLGTKDGVISCLAKSVYRPKSSLKPLLMCGNFLSLIYSTSLENNIAKSLSVAFDVTSFYTDYQKVAFLNLFQEILAKLFKFESKIPFDEMGEIIKALNDADLLSLSLLFLGSVFRELGIAPQVDCCSFCKRTDDLTAFELDSGFFCKDCQAKFDKKWRTNAELYTYLFTFKPFKEKDLKRVVEPNTGKKIFLELIRRLEDYFDLGKLNSVSAFLNALSLDYQLPTGA